MPTPVEYVAIYVVRPDGRGGHEALQMLRGPGRYLEGKWAFAGGKVEPGEHPDAAAVRELREETGIEPADVRRLTHLSFVESIYLPMFGDVRARVGYCAVVDADVQVTLNEEHVDARWIGRRAFREGVLWPAERASLAEIWREHLRPAPASDLRIVEKRTP